MYILTGSDGFIGKHFKSSLDGVVEVDCVTYDKEIYAIEAIGGAIKSGFPFTAESRFSMPATIVHVDSDSLLYTSPSPRDATQSPSPS